MNPQIKGIENRSRSHSLALLFRRLTPIVDQLIDKTNPRGKIFENALVFLDLGLETVEAKVAVCFKGEDEPIAGIPIQRLTNTIRKIDLAVANK